MKPVNVVHLHANSTIEDQMEVMRGKKHQIAIASVGEGKVDDQMTWVNEVRLLFKLEKDKEKPDVVPES